MQAIHIGQGLRDRDWPRAIGAALSALLILAHLPASAAEPESSQPQQRWHS